MGLPALSPFALRLSVSLTFSKLYANLHCHADRPDFHQLKDRTSPSKPCLNRKGWWIKTGRDSYQCCYSCCLSPLVLGFTASSLINQNSGGKKTKNYIQDHSLYLLPYPFVPTVFVCSLWDVCWRCLCHRQITCTTFFSLFLLTTQDSRLDFSKTSRCAPYFLYKAKHIHGLSNKIHCLLNSFILNNFSNLHHAPSVYYLKVTGIRKIEESCNSYKVFILTILFLPQHFILIPLNFSRNVTDLLAYKIINACSNCHAC